MGAFVLPPIAEFVTMAFSKASLVIISLGFLSECEIITQSIVRT